MNTRLAAFVIGLLLLATVVLLLVDIALPDFGIVWAGPVLPVRVPSSPALAPLARGGEPAGILGLPGPRGLRPPGFFLRPFGLHREGIVGLGWHVGSFAALFLLALVTLYLAPRRVGILAQVVSNSWRQRLLAAGIGLLGYLGAGLLVFLLFINVVGWPLLLVVSVILYVATALGLVAVGLALGAVISRLFRLGERSPLFHLFVGVVLLFLASIIPYIGWIIVIAGLLMGFGAVLWTRAGDTTGWTLDEARI